MADPENQTADSEGPTLSIQEFMKRKIDKQTRKFWFVYGLMILFVLTATAYLSLAVGSFKLGPVTLHSVWLIVPIPFLSFFFFPTKKRWKKLRGDDHAIMLLFGKIVRIVRPGLVHVPIGCELIVYTVNVITVESTGDSPDSGGKECKRDIKYDAATRVAQVAGKNPPMLSNGVDGEDPNKSGVDINPLDYRMPLGADFVLSYRIFDPELFFLAFGDPEVAYKNAADQLEDRARTIGGKFVAELTAEQFRKDPLKVGQEVQKVLEEQIGDPDAGKVNRKITELGINIIQNGVQFKTPRLPAKVAKAIEERAAASAQRATDVTKARGQGEAREQVALGEVKARNALTNQITGSEHPEVAMLIANQEFLTRLVPGSNLVSLGGLADGVSQTAMTAAVAGVVATRAAGREQQRQDGKPQPANKPGEEPGPASSAMPSPA